MSACLPPEDFELSFQAIPQLASLGWDVWFAERFAPFDAEALVPARVRADYGAEYLVHDGETSLRSVLSRNLRNDGGPTPAVGEWDTLKQLERAVTDRCISERS